ncbi:Nucleoporin Nup43 [Thoreauomyces humboldtii]|nr:Nucleoporin Nup43 [Thoreauomyces humboldtii]
MPAQHASRELDYCVYTSSPHPTRARFSPNPSQLQLATTHATSIPTLQLHTIQRPESLSATLAYGTELASSITLPGICEALCWASPDVLLTGGKTGVGIYQMVNGELERKGGYNPFGDGVSVRALHVRGNGVEVAVAGQNGKIELVRLNGQAVRRIGDDTSAIVAIEWRGVNELVTASSSGLLTLYDLRKDGPGLRLGDQNSTQPAPLNCLAVHPTLHDKIATGDANGIVGIWDIRKMDEAAMERMAVHNGGVWDVAFHPDTPGKIVSCSEDGSICVARWSSEGVDLGFNWKSTSGLVRYQSRSHPLAFTSIDVHAETNLLAGAGDAGAIVLQQL